MRVRMERVWAMPNRRTFLIKPIASLLKREMGRGVWVDPFCGESSLADIRNDLNPDIKQAQTHLDAYDFLCGLPDSSADGCLFDPPYSFYQLRRCYQSVGANNYKWGELNNFWSRCKDEIARVVKPGGKVICFGWNSVGIGKGRGFVLTKVLLVCHGSVRNDTIVTVEVKG